MTIEIVERYITNDGRLFTKLSEAETYITDEVSEYIEQKLYHGVNAGNNRLTHKQTTEVINNIVGELSNLKELYNFIDKLMR